MAARGPLGVACAELTVAESDLVRTVTMAARPGAAHTPTLKGYEAASGVRDAITQTAGCRCSRGPATVTRATNSGFRGEPGTR
jgi:hypothetical protein